MKNRNGKQKGKIKVTEMEQPGQNNLRSAKFSNLLLLVGGPEMCERRDPDRVALIERQAKPAKEVQV